VFSWYYCFVIVNIVKWIANIASASGKEATRMYNNIYIQEKVLEQEQRCRMQAIENRHNVALATKHHSLIRHIVGRCGTFLIMLGTRLEQAERSEIPVRA